MANRRFAVHELRNVIVRMRLGETDRQIARAKLMGRHKAATLRSLAAAQGWLSPDKLLPGNEEIAKLLTIAPQAPRQASHVEPFSEMVLGWAKRGISGVAIHQTLIRNHGFSGSYDSVKRFLRRHRETTPPSSSLQTGVSPHRPYFPDNSNEIRILGCDSL